MRRLAAKTLLITSCAVLPACQTAGTTAGAAKSAGGQFYAQSGGALREPLHTFNLMQDQIPPVLLRAERAPYDLTGVNSCQAILDRVAELDLALGPDVDMPKERRKTKTQQGATFAASTAVDVVGSAVTHFIPFDGEIKQVTGAKRYENQVRHAVLSGQVRRSYLKTVGMTHGCAWPAAPLAFKPPQPMALDQPWAP